MFRSKADPPRDGHRKAWPRSFVILLGPRTPSGTMAESTVLDSSGQCMQPCAAVMYTAKQQIIFFRCPTEKFQTP